MAQKTIGRYEIRSELGRGGMGAVYVAYDPTLEREVALKLLPSYFAQDAEFSARFAREAKTIAGLDHQAIVAVYDFGEDDVWPYFVMRYMRGGSLKDRLASGPVDLAQANHIIQRIGSALDKAHSNGVVHRDLKPANILYDDEDQPYLGDFGIVRLAESSENFTRTGNALGTPAYMSPEQADAVPDIDGRSDVYSLGIVLFEMLSGQTPYQHDSMPRLLIMHLTSPIPNLIEVRPDLPPALQDVINKAMAKERDSRYQSAGAMAAAVQGIVAAQARPQPKAPPAATRTTSAAAAAAAAAAQPKPPPAATPKPPPQQQPAAAPKPAPQPSARQASPTPAPVQRPAPAASQPAQSAAAPPPVAQPAATQQPAPAPTPAQQPAPAPAASQPAPSAAAPASSGSGRIWIFALVGIMVLVVVGAVVVGPFAAFFIRGSILSGSEGASDQSQTLQAIIDRGELRVGMNEFDMPPLFSSPGGQGEGFVADIFAAIAERLTDEPVSVVYHIIEADQLDLQTIKDRSADLSTGFNDTNHLAEFDAVAAGNYFLSGQVVAVHQGSGITDWHELDGAIICMTEGIEEGPQDREAFEEFAEANGINYEPAFFDLTWQALEGFSEGRCDGVTTHWLNIMILSDAQVVDIVAGELIGGIGASALAVSADDPDFGDEVNAALEEIVADGTYEQLFRRWFNAAPPYSVQQMLSTPPVSN